MLDFSCISLDGGKPFIFDSINSFPERSVSGGYIGGPCSF